MPPSRPHILSVDDEPDSNALVAALLGRAGYAVVCVADAAEALQALRASSFDLVITDYNLPGRTGLAMLADAEREGLLGATPVLIVTAQDDLEPHDRFSRFTKPLKPPAFVAEVKRLLDHKRG